MGWPGLRYGFRAVPSNTAHRAPLAEDGPTQQQQATSSLAVCRDRLPAGRGGSAYLRWHGLAFDVGPDGADVGVNDGAATSKCGGRQSVVQVAAPAVGILVKRVHVRKVADTSSKVHGGFGSGGTCRDNAPGGPGGQALTGIDWISFIAQPLRCSSLTAVSGAALQRKT